MQSTVLWCATPGARRARVVLALVFLLVTPGGLAFSVRAADPLTTQTPVTRANPGTLIGRTNPTQAINLAVPLKPANQAALDAFLADLANPASPTYHHYLSPQQFTQRFFDLTSRKQVVTYLHSEGLTVHDPGVGAVIDAAGSAAQVEKAFTVTLSDFRDAAGNIFYANDVTPAIPVAIASLIHGLLGLDNAPSEMPAGMARDPAPVPSAPDAATRQSGTGCAAAVTFAAGHGTYLPNQFATAYHFTDLYALGDHGEGQTIAVYELSDYHDTDPATYQTCFGTSVPLTRTLVDGGPTGASQYSGEGEVDGDVEDIVGLAPNLTGILVYEAPNTTASATNQYQQIANDALAPVVSTSWGNCEANRTSAIVNARNTIFQQMAAQGQTIFASAGDHGSTSCLGSATNMHVISAEDPSIQPYVTGVGGTHLTIDGTTNAWVSESVWNTYPSPTDAGGGGLSIFWSQPAWQTGPGTTNVYNTGQVRQAPDVTATGDFQYTFYVSGTWGRWAGTSFAAPLWAAGITLVNQNRLSRGIVRVGFLNPLLYTALHSSLYGTAFHDITSGDSCVDPASPCGTPNSATGLYPATVGYDLASGIGSPHFGNLAPALDPPNALPGPRLTGGTLGNPNPLPVPLPSGVPLGNPNPLPVPRP